MESIKKILSIERVYPVGVTEPLECVLENGETVIVKYPRNRFGTQVLINEWIGACIADRLGVPIPRYGLCYLSKENIEKAEIYGKIYDEIDERNVGISFYSVMFNNASPIQIEWLKEKKNKQLAIIVLYDYILNNCDRHKGNILRIIAEIDDVICIDNSHIILDKGDNWKNPREYLDENKLLSIKYFEYNSELYSALLAGCNQNELYVMIDDIKKKIDGDFIRGIIDSMPIEWINSFGREYVETLLEVVRFRILKLDVVSERILSALRRDS